MTVLSVVLLPAPLRPSKTVSSFLGTTRSTPSRMWYCSIFACTSVKVRAGFISVEVLVIKLPHSLFHSLIHSLVRSHPDRLPEPLATKSPLQARHRPPALRYEAQRFDQTVNAPHPFCARPTEPPCPAEL